MSRAAGGLRCLGRTRDVAGDPGVDKPVADTRCAQHQRSQLSGGKFASPVPVGLWIGMFGQPQSGAQWARTANPNWVSKPESKSASGSVFASFKPFSKWRRLTCFVQ